MENRLSKYEMISRLAFAALALVAAQPAAAQQRLFPEEQRDGVLADYESNVRLVLGDSFRPGVVLRAIVYPSFQPEYAVGLRSAPGGGKEIFAVRPELQIWGFSLVELMEAGAVYAMAPDGTDSTEEQLARLRDGLPADPRALGVVRCSVPADERLAGAVTAAWRRMLEGVRPRDRRPAGLDGVRYSFAMDSGGRTLAGMVWEPRRGSRAEALAQLASAIRARCENPAAMSADRVLALARSLAAGRGRRIP